MAHGTSRRRHPQGGVSALLMLLAASFSSNAGAGASSSIHFDIPAGDALKTLQQFGDQAHVESMLYSSDVVRGVRTNAVRGELTMEQALAQMLAGSDLVFEVADDLTFATIERGRNKNETGSAEVQTTQMSAAANARDSARGPPDVPPQAFAKVTDLEEVVITGTLMHGVLDIMSPLAVIGSSEMKRTAYATVQEALQTLTFTSNAGPSEDVGGLGNFARGSSVNLRGLGSGATLVLIDGYRQPLSGTQGDFIDVSNIPWSAVERIEVLPDGASALYGSDAIAGVVNIVMRKDLAGAETWARLGSASGGPDEKLIAQLFGTSWRSGRVLMAYQYSERNALPATDRDYSANADKSSRGGTDHRISNGAPGNILDPRTLEPAYGIPRDQDGSSLTLDDVLASDVNLLNRNAVKDLLPEKRIHSFYLNHSQTFGDKTELFTEGRFSKANVNLQLFAFDQVLNVPAGNPYAVNPFPGLPYVLVGYSFLNDLGPTRANGDVQTYSGTLGVKQSIGDTWRLRLSGSYGRETMVTTTRNVPDQQALSKALASTDPVTAFNAFGDGRHNSVSVIESIRSTQINQASSDVLSGTLVADGTVAALRSGDVKLAIGSEVRSERFGNAVGGDMPFTRKVESAFGELSVPIVGQANEPRATPRLELSLAGRYERYDDFGATWNPKIGVRWAPWNFLKLRTSWGTSFKAPKLADLNDASHNLDALALLKDPSSSSGFSPVLFSIGNNPDLEEESSSTWTAGIDITLPAVPQSSLSVTFYSIDYTNRIVLPGLPSPSDILLQEDQWRSVINRNPSQSDIEAVCASPFYLGSVNQCRNTPIAAIVDYHYRNLSSTEVRGLDLNFDQTLETSRGSFRFGLSGSYLFSFEQAASNSSRMVGVADTVGNPLSLRLRGSAEWYQHRWDLPGFGVNLAVDHKGSYEDIDASDAHNVAAFTTVDLRFSYRTSKLEGALGSLEFSLNASNIFDRAPPFIDREDGYDLSNMDPYGRVVSLGIQKNW